MSIYNILNEMSYEDKRELINNLSKDIIKDPEYDQDTVVKSLSVIETIISLNTIYDFNEVNLIVDQDYNAIVIDLLKSYYHDDLRYVFGSNHPSDTLGVSLSISLESGRKTVVLMDDFSLNYGKTFESLIQFNKHQPDIVIVYFDPYETLIDTKANPILNNFRLSAAYTTLKQETKSVLSNPFGKPILNQLTKFKDSIKDALLEASIFKQFGFSYHGPLKTINLKDTIRFFRNLRDFEGLHLIHIHPDIKTLQNIALPSFKTQDGIPENYVTYIDVVDEVLSEYDDLIVCTDIAKDREHLAQFAIKYPDKYYVSTGTVQSFVDFTKGLVMLDKRVVYVLSSYQYKHLVPLIEEQLGRSKNVIFILRDAGLNNCGSRIKQGVFDIAYTHLSNYDIYMGRNVEETASLLKNILDLDEYNLSILRIPRKYEERIKNYNFNNVDWELLKNNDTPKGVILSYGPQAQAVKHKIEINNLNLWLVDTKNIFNFDQDILEEIINLEIPLIIYDLEDYYHTLYKEVSRLAPNSEIINISLNNVDLNLSARDIKLKYRLNVDRVIDLIK